MAGGIIIEGTKNTKMAFYYFGLYSFGCAGVASIMFIIGKLFCKRATGKETEEEADADDDEAAVALQPDGDEKEAEAKKADEEEIEKEMVVDVKINTTHAT